MRAMEHNNGNNDAALAHLWFPPNLIDGKRAQECAAPMAIAPPRRPAAPTNPGSEICPCRPMVSGLKAQRTGEGKTRVVGAITTLRSPSELEAEGLLAPGAATPLEAVSARYALAITPEMVRLVERGAADDPIARQFVPDLAELQTLPGELADPFGEAQLSPVPGVVHRYADRVLLKLTHVCPVYCRFCFRREVVGPGGPPPLARAALKTAIAYIAATPKIWEVILTGGDPFMLSPRRLAEV